MQTVDWPRVGYELHDWRSTLSPDLVSARVRLRHRGPYEAAVVPPIADLTPALPSDISALVESAAIEITRFDTELGAEIAPFASVLLRSESASSSRIEHLTSGAKSIAMAELGSRAKSNATEIVGNVAAMVAALTLADRLDGDAILGMHRALLVNVQPGIAGRFRAAQVWIGGDSFGPHGATFVPPHHHHVPDLIDDLVSFINRPDLPLLSQAAIAHAQFETIHPFPDGNGRTGRALIHAMLHGHGLTNNVTVPVSAGLLVQSAGYFDALTQYRGGDPVPIVASVAGAALEAVSNGRQLVDDLRTIRREWAQKVRLRRGSVALRLLDVLLRQPVVDAVAVARELGISPQNAHRAIAPLAEADILQEFTGFSRNRLWQSRDVLDALDDFAARAGRRGG